MAEGVEAEGLRAYFQEARSWDQDRVRDAIRSRRLAWIIAGIAGIVACAAVLAVAALAPLKTVEPFVIRVNQTTGAVDVQTAITGAKPIGYDEAVTKYFLALYVRTRESWLASAAEENFRQVAILSNPSEQKRWQAAASPSNPQSPRNQWGANTVVDARVRNIAFINSKVANVRFTRIVRVDAEETSSDWIATVSFAYTNAPMEEGDRYRNPLGFQVLTYRADPEVAQ
ncbi:virB8 family protein [Novosphingobium panipatense]|uniref:Type IV secretion system protein VirB8 n=1 Tax=Novosphingobium panipatense TaxID=428991 RepID=A0ABY1QUG1_9SPHN|nr:VirB8/TrbF family protein [Novosphingobium panipatense]SMP80780.1 type IV secretion system protein VirB8 [Novosphingobium panipatense]